jgi:hypothetical protein
VAALDDAFARETSDINRRRMRVLAPLMVLLHVAHILHFRVPPSLQSSLSPEVLRWRSWLVLAHGAMLPFLLVACALLFFTRRPRLTQWLGPATAFAYLQHGALVAGIDQIVAANISVYVGYCYGVAVGLALSPRVTLPAYLAGGTTLILSLRFFSSSPSALQTNLPTSVTLTVVSIVLAWLLHANRRQAFAQRTTIQEQREELRALNAGLEQRVSAQVAEIVERAREVERLNTQLQAQVRERSSELSLALARLARERGSDGSLQPGTILAGRFAVDERIGRGGMGTVYAGKDRSTGAPVAIKIIQASSTDQLAAMRRFIGEAGAAATVRHPAVVRMLHVDVSDDGLLFQVQELVEGTTLAQRIDRAWSPANSARLVAVLCDALAAAHAQGIVHRDVKPDNLMLTAKAPGLKLLDFGISKLYDAVSRSDGTAARMVVGTPGYMAPEQAAGEAEVSDRADVYAAGVILFQLMHGTIPSADRACGSAPLGRIIEQCLQSDARARPTAAALARELQTFADAEAAPPLEQIGAVAGTGKPFATVETTVGKHST